MKLSSLSIGAICLTLSLFGLAETKSESQPQTEITEQSRLLLVELTDKINTTLHSIAEIESKSNKDIRKLYHSIDVPAKNHVNLGLVVDIEDEKQGLLILAVTPGGSADAVNIKIGDRLKAINGISLTKDNAAKTLTAINNAKSGDSIKLLIERNGQEFYKTAFLTGHMSPSFRLEIGEQSIENISAENQMVDSSACGRVSTFFRPPRTKRLFAVYVYEIDGEYKINRPTYKLSAGIHKIKVGELISEPELNSRSRRFRKGKILTIEVKPNTTYYLGAKFDVKNRNNIRTGEYWEPVVWKEAQVDCETTWFEQ